MADIGGLSTEEINRVMDLEWEESAQEWEWHALNYVNPISPLIPFPSYCVSRRCGWCSFVIKTGEIVTASKLHNDNPAVIHTNITWWQGHLVGLSLRPLHSKVHLMTASCSQPLSDAKAITMLVRQQVIMLNALPLP